MAGTHMEARTRTCADQGFGRRPVIGFDDSRARYPQLRSQLPYRSRRSPLTGVRAVIAALLATALLLADRQVCPPRRDLPSLGVVMVFPLLTALALRHVTSAHSIVFIGLLPLATAIFGVVRGGERPQPLFWLFSCMGSGWSRHSRGHRQAWPRWLATFGCRRRSYCAEWVMPKVRCCRSGSVAGR